MCKNKIWNLGLFASANLLSLFLFTSSSFAAVRISLETSTDLRAVKAGPIQVVEQAQFGSIASSIVDGIRTPRILSEIPRDLELQARHSIHDSYEPADVFLPQNYVHPSNYLSAVNENGMVRGRADSIELAIYIGEGEQRGPQLCIDTNGVSRAKLVNRDNLPIEAIRLVLQKNGTDGIRCTLLVKYSNTVTAILDAPVLDLLGPLNTITRDLELLQEARNILVNPDTNTIYNVHQSSFPSHSSEVRYMTSGGANQHVTFVAGDDLVRMARARQSFGGAIPVILEYLRLGSIKYPAGYQAVMTNQEEFKTLFNFFRAEGLLTIHDQPYLINTLLYSTFSAYLATLRNP